jgi:exosome complex exonuclease DIS3/RRP44
MLQSKSFVKKTKQGRVQKVNSRRRHRPRGFLTQILPNPGRSSPQIVSEHYLRDGIYCGAISCSACDVATERKLSADAAAILVVDTNVVLHQVAAPFVISLQFSLPAGFRFEDG